MLKAVFFDLDGTLLPMDEKKLTQIYMVELTKKMAAHGYDPSLMKDAVFAGLKNMVLNDGTKLNSDAFFEVFSSIMKRDAKQDIALFDSFYANEFSKVKEACKENPLAKEIISFCNENFPYTVLSTNPIFPLQAQRTRLSFIGLKDSDFSFVTHYENSSYCKPNPMYFKVLLDKFDLQPQEVILFGNDTLEDGDCASSLGIKVYLLNHSLIQNPKSKGTYPILSLDDVIETIKIEIKQHR